ncbi:recombinase family protein [Nocardia sp. NPDC050697]|uniref:recombinase family protein n=1 Tax=Nocardia sp. NPDC050697 TaxID=3155158 RepID=UPI0033CC06DE
MAATSGNLRVLGRLRLSRSTEESTSIERQREIIQQWADANGHTLVGWAEDIDVSGSIDPFEAPKLGPWLNERHPEWDVLAAWKLDRLGRNAIQLNKLFGWCLENGKTLVSCSESIDLSTWAGRMLANVIAGLAEGELEAIRERQRGSRRKLRDSARWAGGRPPFGYAKYKRGEGEGWGLRVDTTAADLVRRIVDEVVDGKAMSRIVSDLNSDGVLTPVGYYATVKAGAPTILRADIEPGALKKNAPAKWSLTALRNMLRSDALRGYVHHGGEVVRDDSGMPVQLAEPLVSADEWELIQATLDRRKAAARGRRQSRLSPLAGVAHCLSCGLSLHHSRKVARDIEYRYYRCENKDTSDIRADFAEMIVEELVLDVIGDVEIMERVWVPGDSKEAELREAITGIDELTRALQRAASATVRERIQGQISALDTRIVELEATPSREARWDYRPTGGTYRAAWDGSEPDERRELLKRSGVEVFLCLSGIEGKRTTDNPGWLDYAVVFPEALMENLGHPTGKHPWQTVSGRISSSFSRRRQSEIVRVGEPSK